jgi:glyoxylase-like metal-dependent hydrolase (beta-lactamase superfamily II)
MVTRMARLIDTLHLGYDRVIGAYEVDGLIVDPGPTTGLGALEGIEPRGLLLTHIHLDHAGGTGFLVRRFPNLRVYVHERGAPHLVDPTRLLRSAGRLYGDRMETLWGEVAPVPEENIVALAGGETVEGDFRVEYTPGHASHHVCYLHEPSGDAFVGDVGGVRVQPTDHTIVPTPPPDIDIELWLRSIDTVEAWSPRRLALTHFGFVDGAAAGLERARAALHRQLEWAEGGPDEFARRYAEHNEAALDREGAIRLEQAAPSAQLRAGIERYLRKRAEREAAASAEAEAAA